MEIRSLGCMLRIQIFLGISCPKHIAFVRGGGKST